MNATVYTCLRHMWYGDEPCPEHEAERLAEARERRIADVVAVVLAWENAWSPVPANEAPDTLREWAEVYVDREQQ